MTDGVGSSPLIPPPMDEHPFYAREAGVIRACIEDTEEAYFSDYSSGRTRTITLKRHLWAAPAPYVGKPFLYVWQGFLDEFGRHVTGEALLMYHPEMPEEQATWPSLWDYRRLPLRHDDPPLAEGVDIVSG